MAKSAKRQARSALAQGFVVPIIGAVISLLLGLIIVDITNTNLETWVWVAIDAILGAGFVWGTRAATISYNFSLATGQTAGVAKGARNLNLVLGIVWGAIGTLMAFGSGTSAVSGLVRYRNYQPGQNGPVLPDPLIDPVTFEYFWKQFLPAFALIVLVAGGLYLLLLERSREPKRIAPKN